jgi:hypothetical integral membrane protein (TIGR02206 family)
VALAVAVPLAARRLSPQAQRRWSLFLAVFLLVTRAIHTWVQWLFGVPLLQQLPLHLCGVLIFVLAWMLWRRSYATFEVAYFWTLGGATQALLTPDLPVGFPHPGYLSFFASHGLLLLCAGWALIVFRFRPRPRSILKALLALNVYALALLPVNLALGTNYLYLLRKPGAASLLDLFGPWPWYLLVLEGVGLAVFALCYLPWWIADLVAQRKGAASV